MTDEPARRPKQPMTRATASTRPRSRSSSSLFWAAVAAKPWATAKPDPRLAALRQREQRLRTDAQLVQRVVDRRHAAYRIALKARRAQIAAARARSQQPALGRGGPAGARRHPAAAHRDTDLVMLRRAFRAMGTDIEFLLDAPPSEQRRARRSTEPRTSSSAWSRSCRASATTPSSRALNRAGRLEAQAPTSSA